MMILNFEDNDTPSESWVSPPEEVLETVESLAPIKFTIPPPQYYISKTHKLTGWQVTIDENSLQFTPLIERIDGKLEDKKSYAIVFWD